MVELLFNNNNNLRKALKPFLVGNTLNKGGLRIDSFLIYNIVLVRKKYYI